MATISNTPRPGYVWDSADNVWYPIGTGPHTHADYITSGSAINPNIVDAKGDIIAATAADTVARLAVGANDTVLTADSSTATGIKWAAVSGGGITLIQETVASALSSLSFTSISSSYKQLLLMWHGIKHSTTGSEFVIRFNNNSGTYEGAALMERAGALASNDYWTNTAISFPISGQNIVPFGFGASNVSYYHWAKGSLLIDNYASTTRSKFFEIDCSYFGNGSPGGWVYARGQGTWVNTAAVTSIDIVRVGGSATFTSQADTSIRLYGIS